MPRLHRGRPAQWRRRNLHGVLRIPNKKQPATHNLESRIANDYLRELHKEEDTIDDHIWEDVHECEDSEGAVPVILAQHNHKIKKRTATQACHTSRLSASISSNPAKRIKYNELGALELTEQASSPVHHHQHPASLMGLPLELREMIYGYAMEDVDKVFVLEDYYKETSPFFFPKTLPSVSYVCKQALHESVLVWIRGRTFNINGPISLPEDAFTRYMMRCYNNEAFGAIKYLILSGHTDLFPLSRHLNLWCLSDLIAASTSLRGLSLSVDHRFVAKYDRRARMLTRRLTIDEILEKNPGLQEIVNCPKLQRLILLCEVFSFPLGLACTNEELYSPLVTWLRSKFKEGGAYVEVQTLMVERAFSRRFVREFKELHDRIQRA
ncbi:hypothetical protein K491DRAFT_684724 [Lophiostoma macrostomum CBS 122681]|uniref:F-box domain-containing protein n=1 Tax=Lophiostoma macrostomum CBS 122681 TaxID=1314788 RepID=A0A6A6SQI5_9PLEO|nr:hypothetical protein K491DRAFT_684724 [Lophiostoma macrostomum CBS 122681]